MKNFVAHAEIKPLEALEAFSPDFLKECEVAAGKHIRSSECLYYLLLEYRRFMPSFYPPNDICLLLANLANAGGGGEKLLVFEPRFVPAAVLLAGSFQEIALPKTADAIRKVLAAYIKESEFTDLPKKPEGNAVVLAGDPRVCLEKGYESFVIKAQSAISLSNWDFLGVKTQEFYRRYWMEKSGMSGILQLPRLKRQGDSAYPAILRISSDAPDVVRMARIGRVEAGQGAVSQERALSLMQDEPDKVNSQDVEKTAINANAACNLVPALWLGGKLSHRIESGMLLGKYAQIIRCQLKRVKITDNPAPVFGRQEDGSFIVREAGMAALQAQCGILLDGCAEPVILEFKRRDSQFKYLLRKNDIIFAFRGTIESLGKVGFVENDPADPTITGTAFYILRPFADINPVWLFWLLQTKDVRNAILARGSGTTMLNISSDDIGALPIRMPNQDELQQILALHAGMAQETNEISGAMTKISASMKQMTSLIN